MDSLKILRSTHRYTRTIGDMIDYYTSVSELLNKYKKPYNSIYWSTYKAYQAIITEQLKRSNPKLSDPQLERRSKDHIRTNLLEYINDTENMDTDSRENMDALMYGINNDNISPAVLQDHVNLILESWKSKKDTASMKGNSYHRAREISAINNGFEYNDFDQKEYKLHKDFLIQGYPDRDPSKWPTPEEYLIWALDYSPEKHSIGTNYYWELPDGFYPELMLWDDEWKMAGTADRIFIETILGERFVDIDDYKTNTSIEKKSFYVRGEGYQMMQYPVNHMMDCKHSYYHLQVSIYALMLERMGFTVRKVGYHHLNTLNDLPYLRDEAVALLEDINFDKNLKLLRKSI